jgi:hypothetical protein
MQESARYYLDLKNTQSSHFPRTNGRDKPSNGRDQSGPYMTGNKLPSIIPLVSTMDVLFT